MIVTPEIYICKKGCGFYELIFKEHSILFESASPSLAFGLYEMFDVEGEATMIFLKCMGATGYERNADFEIFFYGAL